MQRYYNVFKVYVEDYSNWMILYETDYYAIINSMLRESNRTLYGDLFALRHTWLLFDVCVITTH